MNRTRIAVLAASTLLALSAVAGCAATAPAPAAAPSETGTELASVGQWLDRGGCRILGDPTALTAPVTEAPPAPRPTGSAAGDSQIVLTVRGLRNGTARTAPLDLAYLDALPQVECTVDDRLAEGRQATFRGVLLSTVLSALGVQDATVLRADALNDYSVDLPMSDVTELPVLLATRLDGQPMTVAHYGPLRVIYPTTGYDLDPTVYDPRRIWQLSAITVT
ncbi:molybdopterin-dependent oxidoreductase [Nakamurella sp. GG22]